MRVVQRYAPHMATEAYAGPVDFAVFVVSRDALLADGFSSLIDRVTEGTIKLLDLEIIGHEDGRAVRLPVGTVDHGDGFDFARLDGVETYLLDAGVLTDAEFDTQEQRILGAT